MIRLGAKIGGQGAITRFFVASDTPLDKDAIKQASSGTARWSNRDRAWTIPPDPTILRRLIVCFPNYTISPALDGHLAYLMGRQQGIYDASCVDAPVAPGKPEQLMPFQSASVRALEAAGSFILAHQMGLGKTPIVCQALEYLGASRNLIVCPSAVRWSWVEHLKRWSGMDNIYVVSSTPVKTDNATVIHRNRDKLIEKALEEDNTTIVLGYEMLKKHLGNLLRYEYDVIVFDEAHRIKNRKAQVTQAAMQMSNVCARRWLLTGTPIRNNYTDLYTLLSIVDPMRFTSYWNFVNLYLETTPNIFGGVDVVGLKNEEEFNSMLSVYMYKLTKEEVMPELPPIIYETSKLPMNTEQARAYKQMEEEFMLYIEDEMKETGYADPIITAPNTVAKIIRLRQICLMPEMIGGPADSAKLDWLEDRVEEYLEQGERLLIFSFFRQFIDYVENMLEHKGMYFGRITGDVSSEDRYRVQQQLTGGDIDIVIGTGQTMGEGMNLQAATTAIFCDLDWVPAVNQQAEERIQRGDIKKSPNVVRLYHPDTIEQDIMAVLHRKERITSKATGQVEAIRNLLSRKGRM